MMPGSLSSAGSMYCSSGKHGPAMLKHFSMPCIIPKFRESCVSGRNSRHGSSACFSCGGVRNKGPLAGVHAVEPCRRAHLPAAHEDGVAQRRLRRGEAPRLPMAGATWRGSAAAQHVLERQPAPRSDDDGDAVLVRRSIVRLLEMYGTAGGWKPDGTKPKMGC